MAMSKTGDTNESQRNKCAQSRYRYGRDTSFSWYQIHLKSVFLTLLNFLRSTFTEDNHLLYLLN